jgi:hypothetical protein
VSNWISARESVVFAVSFFGRGLSCCAAACREQLGREPISGGRKSLLGGPLSADVESPLASAAYRVVFAALLAFWAAVLIEWAGRLVDLL